MLGYKRRLLTSIHFHVDISRDFILDLVGIISPGVRKVSFASLCTGLRAETAVLSILLAYLIHFVAFVPFLNTFLCCIDCCVFH